MINFYLPQFALQQSKGINVWTVRCQQYSMHARLWILDMVQIHRSYNMHNSQYK